MLLSTEKGRTEYSSYVLKWAGIVVCKLIKWASG